MLNDGNGNVQDNSARWVNRTALPHTIEFNWDKPVNLSATRIISGYYTGSSVVAPLSNFTLQWHDGTEWKDVLASVEANTNPAWAAVFPPVRTRQLRLLVTKTQNDISRIWEVEFYKPSTESP